MREREMDVLSGRKSHMVFTVNLLNIFQRNWKLEKGKDNELCTKCQFLGIIKLGRLGLCKRLFFL